MQSTTMTSKFQITIPKSVREKLGVKPGQRFYVLTLGHTIRLVPRVPLKSLKGIAKGIDSRNIRETDWSELVVEFRKLREEIGRAAGTFITRELINEGRRDWNQAPPKSWRR
ncbi:MAG: AbrB/MazE/SpoVT family DNA-binding domain-containing protein [Nitrospirota bacterium]